MRDQCAVSKTLFQCGCTRRRNRRRLSPFSEYAPTASRIKPESNATFKRAHYRFMRPSMRPLHRQSLVFWLTFYPILPPSSQDIPHAQPPSTAAILPFYSNLPTPLTAKGRLG